MGEERAVFFVKFFRRGTTHRTETLTLADAREWADALKEGGTARGITIMTREDERERVFQAVR